MGDQVTFLSLSKLNKDPFNWRILAVAFCFSFVVLFGSPIHEHDLELSHSDFDCVPCHLFNSNVSLETNSPLTLVFNQAIYWFMPIETSRFPILTLTSHGRAPPAAC